MTTGKADDETPYEFAIELGDVLTFEGNPDFFVADIVQASDGVVAVRLNGPHQTRAAAEAVRAHILQQHKVH